MLQNRKNFFYRLIRLQIFEEHKKRNYFGWKKFIRYIFFFPIFWILFFSPSVYFAYSFGDGSHVKVTHGKLDYIALGKPNVNNLIVYPDDGDKSIGGYSVRPCGNFNKATVIPHLGESVVVWYKNNSIYQLTFESNSQLIIPECNMQDNIKIYKDLPMKFGLFCLVIILLSLWHIYSLEKIIGLSEFNPVTDRKRVLKIIFIYGFSCLGFGIYFGRNFTTLIELIFGSFK